MKLLLFKNEFYSSNELSGLFAYLEDAVREFGHISFENTACNVSHSINARLWVFTIPAKSLTVHGHFFETKNNAEGIKRGILH